VNTPSALGAIGGTTGLMPSLTLGCGAIGGSATSENVGPMDLLNLKYVAYGIKTLDDIRNDIAKGNPDNNCCVSEIDPSKIEEIVQKIIQRLQSA